MDVWISFRAILAYFADVLRSDREIRSGFGYRATEPPAAAL